MKILYKSSDIRTEIISLIRNSNGRRVVISAFVGKGAEDYLPNPKGIELICWAKPGSTNPHAIRKLIQNDVKVYFADRVHTKLYWTSDIGAIITSANLSTNALGSGGLIEFGVLVDSVEIDIEKVIKQLNLDDVSRKGSTSLQDLDEAHKDFTKRNPKENLRNKKAYSFNDWFTSTPSLREKWKLADLEYGGIKLATSVRNELKKDYNKTTFNNWMSANKDEYFENEWILQLIKGKNQKIMDVKWIYADRVFQVTEREKKEINGGLDMQIVQISGYRNYEQPPFSVGGEKIKKAIKKAYNELYTKRYTKVIPSNNFINKIREFYK
jgi:hypothetical protein